MERYLSSELKAGKDVSVKIEIGYLTNNGLRPNNFVVKAMIDGEPWIKEF